MYANTTSARIGSGFLRSVHISRKSGLGLLDDGLEGLRIGHGQFGQSATIKLNAGEVQALDEAVVGDAFSADGGVDTLDPQCAEVTFFVLTVTVCISQTFFPSILSNGPNVLSCTKITSG